MPMVHFRWGDTALRPKFLSVDEILHLLYCLLKVCSFRPSHTIVPIERQPCKGIELPSQQLDHAQSTSVYLVIGTSALGLLPIYLPRT
jgi:hypothetical protein